jgi:hypothetical protein
VAGRGGYQPPARPAAVSGPGAASARTDGGQPMATMPDAQYGEEKTFHDQQAGAPLASAGPPTGPGGPAGPMPVGLDQPSQYPDEPVTAGAASGPGPGPEALARNFATPQATYGSLTELLQGLTASDVTGAMAALVTKSLELGLGQ